MRILLLSPPYLPEYMRNARCDFVSLSATQWYPILVGYCGAYLEGQGHEVKLVDAPARDAPDVVRFLEQRLTGNVDHQLAILFDKFVGIPDMTDDQQHKAWISRVDRRLPAKRHDVRMIHVAGCHQDDTARLNQPFRLIQLNFFFHSSAPSSIRVSVIQQRTTNISVQNFTHCNCTVFTTLLQW